MDLDRKSIHLGVCAFVGTFGNGRQKEAVHTVCGRAACTFDVGPARVSFVARHGESYTDDGSVGSLVLLNGRPFFEDRLVESGAAPEPDQLDGKFAYLSLTSDGLELATDCLGAGSVFYASQGGQLFFSSHLGLLLQVLPQAPDLNDLGVAAQLFSRNQVFDETHFAGTYRLADGERLSATTNANDGIEVRTTGGGGIKGLLDIDAPRYTLDTFYDLLNLGVQRERYDANSVLMLSGGQDSMTLALAHATLPRRAITYGESYAIDFVRGKQRAKRLGLEFLGVPYEGWTLDTYLDEIVSLNAGYTGLDAAHNMIAYDWASDKANLAAMGFLGDTYRAGYLRKLVGEPDERTVLPTLMKRHDDPILNDVYANEAKTIVEFVTETFRDLARDFGPHRALAILKLKWMQARWLSPIFDLCDWFLPVSHPFMQRRLLASWLQADIDDPKVRGIFGLALERSLVERGFAKDYRGRVPERLWNRSFATAHARRRGLRDAVRCDWQSVIERSRFDPDNIACRDHRLSEVTQRSWQKVLSGAYQGPVISPAYTSTAIAAAYGRLSSR